MLQLNKRRERNKQAKFKPWPGPEEPQLIRAGAKTRNHTRNLEVEMPVGDRSRTESWERDRETLAAAGSRGREAGDVEGRPRRV